MNEQKPEPGPGDVNEFTKPTQQPIPAWFMPAGGLDYFTSLRADSDENESLIYNARQGEGETLADMVGQEFDLAHFLVHQAEKELPDGEVATLVRIVLITPDGRCLSTFSDGVMGSLKTLFGTRGLPPYAKPVRFKVATRKTGKGFKLLILERVFAAKPGENGAKKAAGKP